MGIIGFTRAAAAVALSTCAGLASAEAAVIYNLGSLAQGSSGVWSIGEGVNAAGQVAGDTTVAGATHAFRYDGVPGSGGVMGDLGSLGGHSHALDINAHGQVVGGSYTTGNLAFRAFRYDGTPGSGGVMRELPTLGGNDGNAIGINAAGQVVGSAQLAGNLVSHAFRYDGTPGSDGVIHDLGTLGGNQSSAAGINASGQIAGSSEFTASSFQHAFRYDGVPGGGGVMRDLGTLGGARSFAKAINSSGQVIGYSELASGTRVRGFRYDGTPGVDGVMRELVSLGGADSIAQDINDGGFVVGRADLAQSAGFRAALWRPDRSVVNLDAWLDAADPQLGAHWLLSHAHGISDNGWITGIGIYNDGPGGLQDGDLTFLLDASALVPEPGGAAILGACAVTTLRRRRPAQ